MSNRLPPVSMVAVAAAIAGFFLYLTLLTSPPGNDAAIPSLTTATAAGEKGQALFDQKCKGCHTIGGGKTVGPDLKGITSTRDKDWLIKFTAAPDRLIAQGDPLARQLVQQYGMPMPNLGLSEDQARDIMDYIESRSGGAPPAAPTETRPAPVAVQSKLAGNPGQGRDIFAGSAPLKNGGASCLSCHSVAGLSGLGGGTLAVDLTNVYPKMGEQALVASLKTTPFPIMKDAYAGKALTENEINDLVAFLAASSHPAQGGASQPFPIFIVGAIGAVALMAAFQFFWRGRLSAVRGSLVNGGGK